MANTNSNYSEAKRNKKNRFFLIVILSVIALFIVGLIAAYYSDVLNQTGSLTTNTLDIEGSYTFYLNGVATPIDEITAIDPGDVIVIKGSITNTGSQSAWIRDNISFGAADSVLLSYLKVYNAEYTQEDFLVPVTDNLIQLTDGNAYGAARVINGTVQTESGGTFTYIGNNEYDFTITVYFMHTAPNSTQGANFGLSITTQALQFRNNNADVPLEDAWATVAEA